MQFAFENDLAFQAGKVGIVADEVLEFIGVMAMRHLIVGNLLRQITCFVNRNIDIRLRMGIAIDKNMALHRQRGKLAQRPLLFMLAAEHPRARFYYVVADSHFLSLLLLVA